MAINLKPETNLKLQDLKHDLLNLMSETPDARLNVIWKNLNDVLNEARVEMEIGDEELDKVVDVDPDLKMYFNNLITAISTPEIKTRLDALQEVFKTKNDIINMYKTTILKLQKKVEALEKTNVVLSEKLKETNKKYDEVYEVKARLESNFISSCGNVF